MSYREVRSFAETMRLLGYPNLISMESFKKPNVELVSHCVYWLIKRYEPSSDVTYNIELESDRVYFFKEVCRVALQKGRIKLNVKKLYQSDGYAVQEMLKLASVLKSAMRTTADDDLDYPAIQQMASQKNVSDAKQVQQLCSDITSDGSNLFFMIEREMTTRADRLRVLSRATEVSEFERRIRELLMTVSQQVEQLQQSISNLTADESNLEQKIENKKTQLERAQKRLKSLMAVRPQFVEEYEKHEEELHAQFVKYLEQYRNLEYLEHELAVHNDREDARLKEQEIRLRVMRERLRKEELQTLLEESNNLGGRRDMGGVGGGGGGAHTSSAGAVGRRRMQDGSDNMGRGGNNDDDDDDDDDTDGEGLEGGNGRMRPPNAVGRNRPSPTGMGKAEGGYPGSGGSGDNLLRSSSPESEEGGAAGRFAPDARSGAGPMTPFKHGAGEPMEEEANASNSLKGSVGASGRRPPAPGRQVDVPGGSTNRGQLDSDSDDDDAISTNSSSDSGSDISLDSDSDDSDI